jgi:eukaryotic-like serine/threonine-protein kinase
MIQAGSGGKSILAERYELVREVGRGGMAVYLADDQKHGRQVAVKALQPELSAALGKLATSNGQ